ncbi:MAG TPA: MFS transporter [Chloroflexota bacterium]|nr:MFS transporter [Chloroflexota bacterium]
MAATEASTSDAIVARLERLPFSGVHARIMTILGFGTFFDSYDTLAIASALTVLPAILHIDLVTAGLLIGLAYVGQLFGAILFGILSELYGRKAAYVGSLLTMGLFSLGSALAWDFQSLLMFRILAGIGLGGEVPVAGAMMTEFVQGHRRGRHFFVYQTLYSWGNLLTPLIGFGLISAAGPALGWRLLLGLGSLPVIVGLISLVLLPESIRWLVDKGRLSQADEVLGRIEKTLQARGTALPPYQVRARADVQPVRFGELFRGGYGRRTALCWLQWFCCYIPTVGLATWLPSLYTRIAHLPPQQGLLLTVLSTLCGLIAAYICAFGLIDRLGRKPTFCIGFGGMALGALIGVAEVAGGAQGWQPLFIAACVILVFLPLNAQGAYLYTSELFPTRMRAWASSTGRGSGLVASIVAPIAVGALLASTLGAAGMFGLFALMSLLGLITIRALGIETKGAVLEEVSA